MLLTLLVWIYITLVCLAWGNWLLRLTGNADAVKGIGSIFIALFAGLAVTGTIGLYLSLFMGLSFVAHLVILIPAICFYFFPGNRRLVKEQCRETRGNFSYLYIILGVAALLMILAISSYTIIHPDTIRYHAQGILWMEKYPVVPGTSHVDLHLGLQSWWFAVLALFRFSFVADHHYIFVNGCILAWFIFFLADRLGHSMKRKDTAAYLAWILLFVFSLLSWTQVRLTAASASPDFVAALYLWGAMYTFLHAQKEQQKGRYFLSLFFCCAAFGIKLSAIVIFLLALFIVISALVKKRYNTFFFLLLVGLVCTVPVLVRNIISSGYPFFPSLFADFFNTKWKVRPEAIIKWQHYITAYARLEAESREASEVIVQYPLAQWVPGWWHRISLADKGLLISIPVLALFNLATIKKQIRNRNVHEVIVLVVSFAGCLTWFLSAPDPRFGTGFLIPMAYILYAGIGHAILFRGKNIKTNWYKAPVIIICLTVVLYSAYRLVNFFEGGQLLLPKGVIKKEYVEKTCQGIKIYVPTDPDNCGMAPIPCLKVPCDSILIIDFQSGFRGR
jgi:hypothetical protein